MSHNQAVKSQGWLQNGIKTRKKYVLDKFYADYDVSEAAYLCLGQLKVTEDDSDSSINLKVTSHLLFNASQVKIW